ncbi:MAG: ExbD/TolR family protein [Thermoguttaceae bacterium]
MKLGKSVRSEGEFGLQMTPMIDCVFQLLIFFLLSFKIAAPEGDFNIKMPAQAAAGVPDSAALPPIKIRITAAENGKIAGIKFADVSVNNLSDLRTKVRQIVGDAPGPGALESTEIEFDCDYNLRYEYVVQAMTAVSGYIRDGQVIKLVEKIKFTPPKKPL